ncbi:ABC transporter permease [Agrobacterium rubi]|uniref:ABC transporter permease n=1 Tax=Agrobacterium rubi TaxID=28099 RepID=A0AAE7UQY1_9HYPH|nr:ABC transporter permease [Agrobacterium rubi]QTG03428.1 ABC transporter permease [Agrobacterium rubi]
MLDPARGKIMFEAVLGTRARGGFIIRKDLVAKVLPPVILIAIFLGFGIAEGRVLLPENLLNIVIQTSYLSIFAIAQTIVLVTRGFDLSLGGIVSVVSVTTALALTSLGLGGDTLAVFAGLLCGLMFGVIAGSFNGMLVAQFHVNPFIATLGTYNICLGIATTVSSGRPVFNLPEDFAIWTYSGDLFGLPIPVLVVAIVGLLVYVLFSHTTLGRAFFIIGSNERAAVVAGLPTRRIIIAAYTLSAVATVIGAILLTGRTGSGEPSLGGTLTLQSIAAAVIGGVSLRGGRGSVAAALFGALFVTVLANGMNLTQINGYVQMIVLGVTVILSATLDRFR